MPNVDAKKLIRRGIAAGVVAAIMLIAIVVTTRLSMRSHRALRACDRHGDRGHVYHNGRGERPAQTNFVLSGLPFCRQRTVDSINVQAGQSSTRATCL